VIGASHRAVARSQAAGHYFGGPRHVLVDPGRCCRCGDTVTPAADELGLQRIQVFAPLRASVLEGRPACHVADAQSLGRLTVAVHVVTCSLLSDRHPTHMITRVSTIGPPAFDSFRRRPGRQSCAMASVSSATRSGSARRMPCRIVVWSRSSSAPMSASVMSNSW